MIKFLFYIEREFHIALFKNIIDYIVLNKSGIVKLLIHEKSSQNGKLNYGAYEEVIRSNFEYEIDFAIDPYEYNPDFTFVADSSYEKVEGLGRIVSIGHGTICKGSFFVDNNLSIRENCADVICVPGPIHKQVLEKYVDSDIIVSGMPKLDNLYSEKKLTKTMLGLDEQRKTVLIAPTYNPEFSLMRFLNEKIISQLLQKYNLIFKFHGVENQELVKQIRNLCEYNNNCYISEEYDVTEVMKLSDMLVSDVSSVVYEYLALDRPIILFDSPHMKDHRKYNENDLEHKFRDVGIRLTSLDILSNVIDNQLDNDDFKDTRKWIKRLFIANSNEVSSSKMIIDKLANIEDKRNKTCIIILKDNNLNHLKLQQKIGKQFNVCLIENKNDILEFFTKCKDIIFMDSKYNYSNLYVKFLSYGMNHNKSVTLPLISSSITNNDQKIENFFPVSNNLNNNQISSSITYQNPGVYIPVNNFEPISFGIPGNYCSQFVNANSFDDVIKIISDLKKVVTLDTYVYEN